MSIKSPKISLFGLAAVALAIGVFFLFPKSAPQDAIAAGASHPTVSAVSTQPMPQQSKVAPTNLLLPDGTTPWAVLTGE